MVCVICADCRPPLFRGLPHAASCASTQLLPPPLLAMRLRLHSQGRVRSAGMGWSLATLLVSLHVGAVAAAGATAGNSYTEDLTLERLGKHHVAARFVFRSHWVPQARHRCQDHEDWYEGGEAESGLGGTRVEEGKLCHFEAVFPRAVGVLLDRFKVRFACVRGAAGLGEQCKVRVRL